MKKLIIAIFIISTLFLNGCNKNDINDNEGENLYNDNEKIVQDYDNFNYSFRNSKGEKSKFEMSFKVFSGTDTLMKINANDGEKLNLNYNIKLKKGNFKLVLISPDNELNIISEGDGDGTYESILKDGEYRIKAVGNNAKGSIKIKADTNAKVKVIGSN